MNKNNNELVETPSMIGHRLGPDHLLLLADMFADPDVMKTLGGVRNLEETQAVFKASDEQWDTYGYGVWAFFLKETTQFVGRGGLITHDIDGSMQTEIAYAVTPPFWGRGLATEMAEISAKVAFDVMALDELVCFTMTDNEASKRVMEKVGFIYEKDFTYADLPHVLCRLRREAWVAA